MKKLTYLVASLLTTATVGMTFTGCIDNDEPYGIEQLRGAKAELLKSKKALIEADAQYKLALAEAEKLLKLPRLMPSVQKPKLKSLKFVREWKLQLFRLSRYWLAFKLRLNWLV